MRNDIMEKQENLNMLENQIKENISSERNLLHEWQTQLENDRHNLLLEQNQFTNEVTAYNSNTVEKNHMVAELRATVNSLKEENNEVKKELSDMKIDYDGLSVDKNTLEQELENVKRVTECKVCLCDVVSVVFSPCGHVCTCENCAVRVENCPLCRSNIIMRSRIYLS